MGYGFAGYFGFKRESTWGTGAAATSFIEILNEDIKTEIERFDYKNVINTLAPPDDMTGVNRHGGSVACAAHPANCGMFFESLMNGGTRTVVDSGTLWKHVYKQPTVPASRFSNVSPTIPYTFEIFRDVGSANRYSGCVVDALNLNWGINQDLRINADIIAKSTSIVVEQSATYPSTPEKPFKFTQTSISIGGTATADIENLDIKISNQFEGIPVLNGSSDIGKIRRSGFQRIEINGTLDFDSLAEYNRFIAQSETNLSIATVQSSYSLIVTIPRFVYSAFPIGISGRDRNTVSFNALGFFHVGSNTGIELSLTTPASYF